MNDTRSTNQQAQVLSVIFVVGSILLMFSLAIGMAVVRSLIQRAPPVVTPTPWPSTLSVLEPSVYAGGPFTLVGAVWPPRQVVFVYLADPNRPGERQVVFRGQADDQGRFVLKVLYPAEPRWAVLQAVDVIALSTDPGIEVTQRVPVSLVIPTPTSTAPPPLFTATPTLTPTVTATLTPTVPAFVDWKGEYFNNPSLSGAPVVIRNDVRPSFNWGDLAPDPSLPADNFSAVWTRSIAFAAGTYRFAIRVDDGARVYVDGILIIDSWRVGPQPGLTRDVALEAGQHLLRVEMFEQTGQALIDFTYEQIPTFTEWKGEYFANRDLSGAPAVTRNDVVVNFNWGNGSPSTSLPVDGFSARWTRLVSFPAGITRFVVRADDGVRLSIDGVRIIDSWLVASAQAQEKDVNLAAGAHTVVLEYYENTGEANIAFVPQPATFIGWKGEYFANLDFSGLPVLVRDDPQIEFNWVDAAPAPGLPPDNFAVRWTRSVSFEAGAYRFALIVDDGARLFLDGVTMIDEWHDGSTTTYSFVVNLNAGVHALRVDYFERAKQARAAVSWARLLDTPTPIITPSPSPSPTSTLPPSLTPTTLPTATPSPTQTPTPTQAPTQAPAQPSTPTPTPTLTPTVTLTSTTSLPAFR